MSNREEEVFDGKVIAPGDLSALAVINSSEIDQQVATAKKYPRSIKAFYTESKDLVTLTEKIAEDCIFALPRGRGKFIEGPSVRFAEIVVSSWGNCRSGSRPMGEERGFVTAQGFFFDLEKNVAIMTEVRRRITDSKGNRYNDDMIGVTVNAACSIARRNAALQGIPKAIWNPLYEEAKKVAIGDATTLVKKRTEALSYFQKMNVRLETILTFLGVEGEEDIGLDELTLLKGTATRIKDGTVSVDDAFKVEGPDKNTRAKEVFDHLKNGGKGCPGEAPVTAEKETPAAFACGDACKECGVSGGHDVHCSKSTAVPCIHCKVLGGHAPSCPDAEPPK